MLTTIIIKIYAMKLITEMLKARVIQIESRSGKINDNKNISGIK